MKMRSDRACARAFAMVATSQTFNARRSTRGGSTSSHGLRDNVRQRTACRSEKVSTWANPRAYARCVARSYRRDFWDQQPRRVVGVSEKGTGRRLLRPVLDALAA